MNRQQAINYLLSSGFSEEQINTIEQAFKQEPTNDLGVDCISRADAERILTDLYHSDICDYCLLDILEDIKALPSVTPQEPKTGHWIMSDDGLYRPICNNCGAHPWKGYIPTVEEATEIFKYCPNCGAKMVEPQESENP